MQEKTIVSRNALVYDTILSNPGLTIVELTQLLGVRGVAASVGSLVERGAVIRTAGVPRMSTYVVSNKEVKFKTSLSFQKTDTVAIKAALHVNAKRVGAFEQPQQEDISLVRRIFDKIFG